MISEITKNIINSKTATKNKTAHLEPDTHIVLVLNQGHIHGNVVGSEIKLEPVGKHIMKDSGPAHIVLQGDGWRAVARLHCEVDRVLSVGDRTHDGTAVGRPRADTLQGGYAGSCEC